MQEKIDAILNRHKHAGALIPILQELQDLEGYLKKDSMQYVAEQTGLRAAEIYGVATFYSMFRLKPQGKHIIRVCTGTACHVSGAKALAEALRNELDLKEGEDTTADFNFTVLEVACLGCCSLAPAIMIDKSTYAKLTTDKLTSVLAGYAKKEEL